MHLFCAVDGFGCAVKCMAAVDPWFSGCTSA